MIGNSLYEVLKDEFASRGIALQYDGKQTLSFQYDKQSRVYIEKALIDFSGSSDFQLRLLNQFGSLSFQVGLHDASDPASMLFDRVLDSIDEFQEDIDYKRKMETTLYNLYDLFQESFNYSGNFGIGIQNNSTETKYILKTDIPEVLTALEDLGLTVEGNRFVISSLDKTVSADVVYRQIAERLKTLSEEKPKEEEPEKAQEEVQEETSLVDEAVSDEAKNPDVDFYEKVIQNKQGENVVVRMAITKQMKENGDYERIVNVSYFDRVHGLATSTQLFSYEDGHRFDQDVLPNIIDGFQKRATLEGREVVLKENDPSSCYITAGDDSDSITLDEYPVDRVHSLLAVDKQENLFGDEENKIDVHDLEEKDLVSFEEVGQTFEEQDTDNVMDEDIPSEEKSHSQDGPRMVKSLGEMPSNAGLSNWMSLGLFLVLDTVAIILGFYLLLQ